MRTHRTSRRLTNRTDVTGPAATGIHPNCIRSLRDTASRLPRVDTLRRSSLPKFHDLAECGPRALAAQLRRRAPALRPVAVGRGPSRCALRAAPPAARCRAVRPEKDRDRDTPARRLRHLPAHCPCSADGRSPRDRLRGGWPSSQSPVRATTLGVDDGAAGGGAPEEERLGLLLRQNYYSGRSQTRRPQLPGCSAAATGPVWRPVPGRGARHPRRPLSLIHI